MDRLLQRPFLPRLSRTFVACLFAACLATGCRPPLPGPTPWNVLVVTVDGLTPDTLDTCAWKQLPLVGDSAQFQRAFAPRPEQGSALESLWFGDREGLQSQQSALPERLEARGIVTGAMLLDNADHMNPGLLERFGRVEILPTKNSPGETMGEGLRVWLQHAERTEMGPWMLWLHGPMDSQGPESLLAQLKADLASSGEGPDTLVVVVGMPEPGSQGQVALAFHSPGVGYETIDDAVGLQDVLPTLAERVSQRLRDPSLAVHTGDGASLGATLLGLRMEREPIVVRGLEPDGVGLAVLDAGLSYRWAPGDSGEELIGEEGLPVEDPLSMARLRECAFPRSEASGPGELE